MHADNKRGVAQWVMPTASSTTRQNADAINVGARPAESPVGSQDSDEYSVSFNNGFRAQTRGVYNDPHNNQQDQLSNLIDMSTCRTICVIIEQYIKELREHQERINMARMMLVADASYRANDENFIAQGDLSRLKVRSEQTKTTETIKQLTSYLRELTQIKNQLDLATNSIDEATYNRLSDIRNSIIQALNDFVLSNSDIDFPILGPDEPNEYDLCIDAQRSRRDIREINVLKSNYDINTQVHSSLSLSVRTNFQESLVQIEKSDVACDQANRMEKRGQELHRIEKDTVELRRLFADFYELVKIQSEQIDTIQDNIVMAAQQIHEGRQHLAHRSARGLTVLVPVTGCVTGALIGGPIGLFIGGKIGSLTIICATSLLGLLSSLGAQRCIVSGNKKADNKKD